MPSPPHRVAILVLPSVVPFDLGVPIQVFGYPRPDLGAHRYRTVVCAERAGPVPTAHGFAVVAPLGLRALAQADTIVVPGIDDCARPIAPAVLRALRAAADRSARLVSICTGAFVLAAAGVLDGRRATTHWMDAPELTRRFPLVRVDPDVLYVDEGQVLTSAGIAAGLDLCLHVVRRDHGAAVANAVARRLVVPPLRSGGQAQFIPAPIGPEDGGPLERTRAWALARLDRPLSVRALAAHAGLPLRTFARHFQREMGTTPLQWIVRQRLLRAQQALETSRHSVDRIARECGFGSTVTLRAQFRRALGTSPSVYRRAFRVSAAR